MVTATRKDKEWESALRDTAGDRTDLLRQKGLEIDEQMYRKMFVDGLGEAEISGKGSTMLRLKWRSKLKDFK